MYLFCMTFVLLFFIVVVEIEWCYPDCCCGSNDWFSFGYRRIIYKMFKTSVFETFDSKMCVLPQKGLFCTQKRYLGEQKLSLPQVFCTISFPNVLGAKKITKASKHFSSGQLPLHPSGFCDYFLTFQNHCHTKYK